MDFSNIFLQMFILFSLMIVGYLCNHYHILGKAENKMLSKLVMTVGVPGLIIASVKNGCPFDDRMELFYVLLVVSGVNMLLPPISIVINKILHVQEDSSLYKFMFIFPNAGFIGFPVISAIFGEGALIYAALFQLPHNVLMYTYGISLVNGGHRAKTSLKDFINPCIVAALIACVICLCDIKEPQMIWQSCTYLGNITTPLGMLIVGSSLADMDMKHVLDDLKVIPFIFLKLLLFPLIVYGIMHMFVTNEILVYVVTITLAMPVATNAVIMTNVYDGNVQLSSKTVFLTTVCSILSIPLLCMILTGF